MRKILVCQHVPHEVLGTLDPLFRKNNFRIRYANFGRFPDLQADVAAYDGLVLLGGPMNIGDEKRHPHLRTEKKLIETALKKNIPVLGICLGAQLIADTLGAPVVKNSAPEIGWYPLSLTEHAVHDPLFRHISSGDHVFHWHGCKFDVPQTATRLAASALTENQAFRYGQNVYGLQFHLEVDQNLMERWLAIPHNCAELIAAHGQSGDTTLRTAANAYLPRQKALSDAVFNEFIGLFGEHQVRKRLPSR